VQSKECVQRSGYLDTIKILNPRHYSIQVAKLAPFLTQRQAGYAILGTTREWKSHSMLVDAYGCICVGGHWSIKPPTVTDLGSLPRSQQLSALEAVKASDVVVSLGCSADGCCVSLQLASSIAMP